MTAWKALERRIADRFGSTRTGPTGKAITDVIGTRWAIEIKRAKRGTPEQRWIQQAITNGKTERKPWLLIVAKHHDRNPIVVCDLAHFLELAEQAGWMRE